jgi:peptidoglycan hydrolase CwlO-like protein
MVTTFKLSDVWKFSTIFLLVVLSATWLWLIITSIVHDSAMENIQAQYAVTRKLTDDVVTMQMQIQDLQSRNKALNEKIDALNTLRQRDVEYLQSQINRGPIKVIR